MAGRERYIDDPRIGRVRVRLLSLAEVAEIRGEVDRELPKTLADPPAELRREFAGQSVAVRRRALRAAAVNYQVLERAVVDATVRERLLARPSSADGVAGKLLAERILELSGEAR